MVKNNKAKGSRNERKSMKMLEGVGYVCTKAGSSLGVWDIIGIGSKSFIVVQVKTNQWPGSEEMETMKLFRCPDNCIKQVHRWRDHARTPDIKDI